MGWLETRIPPPLVAMASLGLMWCLNRWVPVIRWIDSPWNLTAILPAALALAAFLAAARQFRGARTTIDPVNPDGASTLVTTGIFGLSRNPMYVALSLLLCGAAIWLGSAGPWLVIVGFVIYVTRFQINPEERALTMKFGQAYLKYRDAVPRWIFL